MTQENNAIMGMDDKTKFKNRVRKERQIYRTNMISATDISCSYRIQATTTRSLEFCYS
jgi:hypothetical protein